MANFKKNEKWRDIWHLSFFYMLAHIGILFIPNAIYWDDWVIYNMKSDVVLSIFNQAGSMFNFAGYLHIALLHIGPWIYKVLTFILMLGSGIFLYLILEPIEKINRNSRFLLVLLFLILPLNMARFALIEICYTLCYFLFFLAWYFKNIRLIALPIFFLSFNTNSLLVFYVIPIVHMFYEGNSKLNIKSVKTFALKKIDYLLLPLIYFSIKLTWFRPYGNYTGYNESYKIGHLISAPVSQIADLFRLEIITSAALISSIAIYFIFFRRLSDFRRVSQNANLFIKLGVLCLFFGLFPYWILGHVPTFYEWTSRHQLLMPLGSSLLVVGIFYRIKSKDFKVIFLSLIIGVSLNINVVNYYNAFLDWSKQKALISFFKSSKVIRDSSLILFEDETMHSNVLGRSYRFYEWNGMMKKSLGDERRFGIYKLELEAFNLGRFDSTFKQSYKASEFLKVENLDIACVHISKKSGTKIREKVLLKLKPQYELISKSCNSLEVIHE